MFTRILKFYGFVDNRHCIQSIADPTWAQIEEAVRRLDGSVYTCVTVARDREAEFAMVHTLTVGGGLQGQYTCSASLDHSTMAYHLADPDRTAGEVALPIGTEWFPIAGRHVASLDVILAVMRAYAEQGVMEPSHTWEKVETA